MKELLLQYVRYNHWANHRIQTSLRSLSDEQLLVTVGGSFNTIKEIVHHCFLAEKIWIQRLQLVESPTIPVYNSLTCMEELLNEWSACSTEFVEFVNKQWNDEAFKHEVVYYTTKKEICKNTFADIVMHCMNHTTFHRGQIVHALRQIGLKSVPATDMIVYLRGK